MLVLENRDDYLCPLSNPIFGDDVNISRLHSSDVLEER